MDLRKIKTLIGLFEESSLDEMQVSTEDESIFLVRNRGVPTSVVQQPVANVVQAENPAAEPEPAEEKGHPIVSPLLGTFYRKPSPNAQAFVEVGDDVRQGDTVCIIEAMKVMNQIKAPHDGRVAKIVAEDNAPVEFGQTLIILE